jgi:hypothetical protein
MDASRAARSKAHVAKGTGIEQRSRRNRIQKRAFKQRNMK